MLSSMPGLDNGFRARIPKTSNTVHLRLGTTDVAAFEHVFVNEEYGFCLARKPSIIIDVGANIGMSSVYFSMRYPNATVIAVEPDRQNFAVLEKNATLFPKIIPINAAIWNHNGFVKLQSTSAGAWGTRVTAAMSESPSNVRSMTLLRLLQEQNVRDIDVLKIDAEGAEQEIFEDASNWINRVSVICIELHDRFRPGCSMGFKAVAADFPKQWRRGELHCVAREGLISVE